MSSNTKMTKGGSATLKKKYQFRNDNINTLLGSNFYQYNEFFYMLTKVFFI